MPRNDDPDSPTMLIWDGPCTSDPSSQLAVRKPSHPCKVAFDLWVRHLSHLKSAISNSRTAFTNIPSGKKDLYVHMNNLQPPDRSCYITFALSVLQDPNPRNKDDLN